jgi:hypothetical protein
LGFYVFYFFLFLKLNLKTKKVKHTLLKKKKKKIKTKKDGNSQCVSTIGRFMEADNRFGDSSRERSQLRICCLPKRKKWKTFRNVELGQRGKL